MKIYTIAYLDRNLGDDLMIKLMAMSMPEHDFYICESRRTHTLAFSDLKNIHQTDVCFDKNFPTDKFDAVVTIGGSIFMLTRKKYAIERILDLFPVLKKCKRAGLKIATIGCNLGPFSCNFCEKTAIKQLSLNDFSTVRDKNSLKVLNNSPVNVTLIPDMIFSYPIKKQNSTLYGNILGISVYRNMYNENQCMDYYEAMAEIADDYISKTDGCVKLFAFDCGNENDSSGCYTIKMLMKNKHKCEIFIYCGDTDSFLSDFASCSQMIATRFHSMVLAQVAQIPTFPVVYSNKMQNALDDLGYSNLTLEYSNPKQNLKQIVDTIIDKNKLLLVSEKELEQISKDAFSHIQLLKNHLK